MCDRHPTPLGRAPGIAVLFRPETSIELAALVDKQALAAPLDQTFSSNLFLAVRIEGRFREVRTRTVALDRRKVP